MKTKKSFEEAMDELEKIVAKLENGELTLDQSLEAFQEGIELTKFCSKRLDEIEKKVSVLIETEDGKLEEKDFI